MFQLFIRPQKNIIQNIKHQHFFVSKLRLDFLKTELNIRGQFGSQGRCNIHDICRGISALIEFRRQIDEMGVRPGLYEPRR